MDVRRWLKRYRDDQSWHILGVDATELKRRCVDSDSHTGARSMTLWEHRFCQWQSSAVFAGTRGPPDGDIKAHEPGKDTMLGIRFSMRLLIPINIEVHPMDSECKRLHPAGLCALAF